VLDFANVLFAGPCNRACPFCIGHALPDSVNVDNLDVFPPRGLDALVEVVNRERVRDVIFTGTVSDPSLYRHQAPLLAWLRARLHPGARIAIHTNGALALAQRDVFNSYDRACLSFPTFDPLTYERMMGSRRVPDLAAILAMATIPVKVSCVVNEHNAAELPDFLERCRRLGVRRLVFRRLAGDRRRWSLPPGLRATGTFRGNPVFDYDGVEVGWWDFDASTCESVNLFPDGTLGSTYLLTETPELRAGAGGHDR
jgi:MoaA/NifB/PqqE/SkfB family radical SAM enzyme